MPVISSWRWSCLSRKAVRLHLLSLEPHCHYCGCYLNVNWATLDHIVPRSKGGVHAWWNVVLSCRRCNRRKSDRDISECVSPLRRGIGLYRRCELERMGVLTKEVESR